MYHHHLWIVVVDWKVLIYMYIISETVWMLETNHQTFLTTISPHSRWHDLVWSCIENKSEWSSLELTIHSFRKQWSSCKRIPFFSHFYLESKLFLDTISNNDQYFLVSMNLTHFFSVDYIILLFEIKFIWIYN